ncbi:hypothetical protein [Dyadobacter sandarakinus]|uniref:Uncharacterized protein n=1 Tax=Dyadobacter sandarakinus TaxID=2747268 RepID=A0ABX7ICX9_9BACT|nr:hypothetical protein [Dyadobacter sandarakinus]QRR03845.1 hypothetical protein HWI92_24500 [Dyadobacter sandarakinus]
MHTVTIEIPDELSSKEISLSIAKHLYEKDLVSAEQAAKLAGVEDKEYVKNELYKDRAEAWLKFQNRTAQEALQEQVKRQGYTGLDKKKLDALIKKLDVQEPLELLLSQLTK